MTTFLLLIACGIVGGLLFFFLHIPGGAMRGVSHGDSPHDGAYEV